MKTKPNPTLKQYVGRKLCSTAQLTGVDLGSANGGYLIEQFRRNPAQFLPPIPPPGAAA